MRYTEIIKRAWTITWRYRVLWIFGILLALTGSGSGGGGGGGGGSNVSSGWGGMGPWPGMPELSRIPPATWAAIIALCCCILLVFLIVAVVVNYVARTALYRSVNQIEETQAAPTWREGFRLGWSYRAFRLWLLDLIIGIPAAVVAIVLLALGASPLLLLLVDSPVAKGIGIALTVAIELLLLLVILLGAIALSVLGQFWSREVALADRSIGEALASGYAMVRRRLSHVAGMWLLMFGIGLGFAIVVIPVLLVLLAVGGAVGGGLGYAMYALSDSVPLAIALGLPVFLVITVIPMTLIQGIYQVFESSVWTLTYREVAGGRPVESIS